VEDNAELPVLRSGVNSRHNVVFRCTSRNPRGKRDSVSSSRIQRGRGLWYEGEGKVFTRWQL